MDGFLTPARLLGWFPLAVLPYGDVPTQVGVFAREVGVVTPQERFHEHGVLLHVDLRYRTIENNSPTRLLIKLSNQSNNKKVNRPRYYS